VLAAGGWRLAAGGWRLAAGGKVGENPGQRDLSGIGSSARSHGTNLKEGLPR
jgi:hypothetical protein